MFKHPVAVLGYVAIVLAIVVILTTLDMLPSEAMGRLSIANVLGGIGAFLVLLGVIAQGFLRLEQKLDATAGSGVAQLRKTPKRVQTSSADDEQEAALARSLMEKGLRP